MYGEALQVVERGPNSIQFYIVWFHYQNKMDLISFQGPSAIYLHIQFYVYALYLIWYAWISRLYSCFSFYSMFAKYGIESFNKMACMMKNKKLVCTLNQGFNKELFQFLPLFTKNILCLKTVNYQTLLLFCFTFEASITHAPNTSNN